MLDLAEYSATLDELIQAANQEGVKRFLCVSVELKKFPEILACTERYPHVYASVGQHPNDLIHHYPSIEELLDLAAAPAVIAIGETGLDYFRTEADQIEQQQAGFRDHIKVAKQLNKPLIIHTRQAREDTINILREEGAAEVAGVMHCFTEDWDMAKAALDLGFYISFSGILTFKKAIELQEVAKKVPADRILIETDCPYLAPVPKRGKPNQPAYLKYIAEFLAQLRGESFDCIAEQTTENFFRLFKCS